MRCSEQPRPMRRGWGRRALALAAAATLFVSACGDDDDSDAADTAAGDTAESDDAPATPDTTSAVTTAPSTEPSSDAGSADTADAPETTAPAEPGDPIRIGAVLSVTGPASSLGEQQKNTLEMLVEQANAEGGVSGHPIELDIRDDQSNPDRGVEQMRALLQDFEPHAVIGPSASGVCLATKPVTEEAGVIQYCLSAAPIPAPAPFYFAAQSPLAPWIGNLPVQWMQEKGFTKIGCLASDDSSGQLTVDVVKQAAAGAGMEFVSENFNLEDVDVSAQLTRLRDQDPDVIYVCTSGKGVVTVLQGMQQLGMDLPAWISSGSASLDVAALIKDLLPSAGAFTGGEKIQVFEELSPDDPQAAQITEFATDYIEAYDKRPDLFAAAAADAFAILTTSIAEVGVDAAPADVVQYMEDNVDYLGVQLHYDFTADDHRGTNLSGIVARFTEDAGFVFEAQYDQVTDFASQA